MLGVAPELGAPGDRVPYMSGKPLLALVGACSGSTTTTTATTTTDKASADAAAVASVRGDVPWVGFSDGDLISAMLDSCSAPLVGGSVGPIGNMVEWLVDWAFAADLEAEPSERLEALRVVGFGGPEFENQMEDFAVAVFMASEHLCPEAWEVQSEFIRNAVNNE